MKKLCIHCTHARSAAEYRNLPSSKCGNQSWAIAIDILLQTDPSHQFLRLYSELKCTLLSVDLTWEWHELERIRLRRLQSFESRSDCFPDESAFSYLMADLLDMHGSMTSSVHPYPARIVDTRSSYQDDTRCEIRDLPSSFTYIGHVVISSNFNSYSGARGRHL
jgi:hypothetical protein